MRWVKNRQIAILYKSAVPTSRTLYPLSKKVYSIMLRFNAAILRPNLYPNAQPPLHRRIMLCTIDGHTSCDALSYDSPPHIHRRASSEGVALDPPGMWVRRLGLLCYQVVSAL